MKDPGGTGVSLDQLIVDLATSLMGVGSDSEAAATSTALRQLLDFFDVDHVFLRRNDHTQGVSILVGEEPARPFVPDPDPLAVVPFEADPVFAASQHFKEPLIDYPNANEDYDKRVEEAAGQAATFAGVPLLDGTETVGALGLIKFGMRPWADDEIRALSAIATMFALLWGRTEAEKTVRHLAYFDMLTDLPNRQRLQEELDALHPDEPVSLLAIDVDNMSVINDGLSYAAGDQFIWEMAERLRTAVRPVDTVARLQGDRFAVLLRDISTDGADQIARRLCGELAVSVEVAGMSLARSVSIGVAHSTHGTDTLFSEADAAMQRAKEQGRKRVVVYDDSMRAGSLDLYETEIELRQAIERDEITLHFQPEVDLMTGKVKATEALMRWQHPEKGLLPAGVFIEAAEASGLVVEIGDVVLDKAIAQLAEWQDIDSELEMWINISPAQLVSRDLASQVEFALIKHGVPANRICLEVTEHSVLEDIEVTRGTLERLRTLGVQLALDDFGTGYSSMKQLKSLPITTLKIDMSFVAGLGVSAHDTAIVEAAITLANAFGLNTVAEGIEELDQLLELTKRGCSMGQGYYLCRPAAPEHIVTLLGKPLDVAITA